MKCTSCNHEFDAATTGRVECPRCGEIISAGGSDAPAWKPKSQPIDLGSAVKARLKQAMVVTLLIFLVIGGIAFKMFRDERRKQHEPPPQPFPRPSGMATRPADLVGLRYVPAKSNFVAAIQFGPLLAYAERTKQDPVEMLTKNGVPASVLAVIARLGITLQQIDHVVAGLYVPDKDEEIRIGVVVVFRRDLFNERAALEQLKAKPGAKPDIFEVNADKLALLMKRPAEGVWIFGLSEKDFENSPPPSHFLGIIETRVPHDAALFVAADSVAWTKKPIVEGLFKAAAWKPAEIATASRGRAAAIGYSFGESPRLRLAIQCDTSDSAGKLRTYFQGKATGEHSAAGGADDWATLELPADPRDVSRLLKDFLDAAGR